MARNVLAALIVRDLSLFLSFFLPESVHILCSMIGESTFNLGPHPIHSMLLDAVDRESSMARNVLAALIVRDLSFSLSLSLPESVHILCSMIGESTFNLGPHPMHPMLRVHRST
jgi:hypothetical protein